MLQLSHICWDESRFQSRSVSVDRPMNDRRSVKDRLSDLQNVMDRLRLTDEVLRMSEMMTMIVRTVYVRMSRCT